MKRWLTFALLVLALNFAWEMKQSKRFASMEEMTLWRGTLLCFRAALGDLVITAIAFAVAAIVAKGATRPMLRRVVIGTVTFVVVGLAIAIAYEVFALSTGRWRYDQTMPTLFGIGVLPLLQWLLLPLIDVLLFRLISRGAI
jgi:hypothetical protein